MNKYFDHAFASGKVAPCPRIYNWFLFDWIFQSIEAYYENYLIRRNWRQWSRQSKCARGVKLGGNAKLINKNSKESVFIGENSICKGIIRIDHSGKIKIGEEVYIGDNTIISVFENVNIGKGTLIAHGVQIFDNSSHPIDWKERQSHFRKLIGLKSTGKYSISSSSVTIGEYCWLGIGCIVLKGVTIGDRSIIGAGSVVTKDVPPDSLVVGSQFRQIPL